MTYMGFEESEIFFLLLTDGCSYFFVWPNVQAWLGRA